MSTISKIRLAVEVAERSMADDGYAYGPYLSGRLVGHSSKDQWEVEFGYGGLTDRRPTTDPGSIVLLVDLKTEVVTAVSLMSPRRPSRATNLRRLGCILVFS